jgi:hypothetical protein
MAIPSFNALLKKKYPVNRGKKKQSKPVAKTRFTPPGMKEVESAAEDKMKGEEKD